MTEMIITVVVPEVPGKFPDSEPVEEAHTKVFRFEFDSEEHAIAALDKMTEAPGVVASEQLRGAE